MIAQPHPLEQNIMAIGVCSQGVSLSHGRPKANREKSTRFKLCLM